MPAFEKIENRIQRLIRESLARQAETQQRVTVGEAPKLEEPVRDVGGSIVSAPSPLFSVQSRIPQPVTPFTPQNVEQFAPSPLRGFASTIPQVIPTEPDVANEEDIKWFDQPKVIFDKGMEAVGNVISKVPILPKALEFVAPVFEFIHENLEKPWAAVISAPWSPALPQKPGESWIDHQKREYDTWKAPTYVKGISEFSMPLWWLPIFGWTAKGARALGAGNKTLRSIEAAGVATGFELPSRELMKGTFRNDFSRRALHWVQDKPGLGKVVDAVGLNKAVRTIGGESAFVRATSDLPQDIARREIVMMNKLNALSDSAVQAYLPRVQVHGNPLKLLDIDDNIMRTANPVDPNASRQVADVIENLLTDPDSYKFSTLGAQNYMNDYMKVLKEIKKGGIDRGLKPKAGVHRIVEGKFDADGVFHKSTWGSNPELQRVYATQQDAAVAHLGRGERLIYGSNPDELLANEIQSTVRGIAKKEFNENVRKLGQTPVEKYAAAFPEASEMLATMGRQQVAGKFALQAMRRVRSFNGTTIPGQTMNKIREGVPSIAAKIDNALALKPEQVDRVLAGMGKEIRQQLKLDAKEFKVLVKDMNRTRNGLFRESPISMQDLEDVVRHLNLEEDVLTKAIERGYRQSYNLNRAEFTRAFGEVKDEVAQMLERTATEMSPLQAQRRSFLKSLGGQEILGTGERVFTKHPAFRGKFFPAEVASLLERNIGRAGNKWVSEVGKLGAVSRTLTATLDASAGFIQGLSVLGSNPVVWAKSMGKMFDFLGKPQNFIDYMARPDISAVHREMLKHGATIASFEYLEAVPVLQRALQNIPKAGRVTGRIGRETIGRAEAGFIGFGQVARDNMYLALRKPGMAAVELAELTRTVERMTGVLSTEALGIVKTQRDIESAFVFFAPRYTRASASFIADMFVGGMTGAEARKAIGAMMLGGASMYYGVSTSLGQTPNFNPRSAKFMTIKVGEQQIGIGGMMYGLFRLGSNLAATAVENPADLFKLDRQDNPFVSFMYAKAAPLTGIAVGLAIEQADYFGEPFENPGDWAGFLADKVTPIALQPLMPWNEESVSPVSFLAAELGAREFPQSPSTLRDEARNRHARQNYGQEFASLPRLYRQKIDALPEMQGLIQAADERSLRSQHLGSKFTARKQEREDARFVYEENLNGYQRAFDAGDINGFEFKELYIGEGTKLGGAYNHIDRQDRYKEVLEQLENPTNVSADAIGDVAYDELMAASFGEGVTDEFGIFQFDKLNEVRAGIRQKYGEDVWAYIQELKAHKDESLPAMAKLFKQAQVALQPYWAVEDELIKIYGAPRSQGEVSRLSRQVRRVRDRLKRENPEIGKWLEMFYTRPQ